MDRDRMKSTSFGLPRKKLFPLTNKRQAVSAIAYAKKLARERKITPQERNIVMRKVHSKYPSINITPVRGSGRKTKGSWYKRKSPNEYEKFFGVRWTDKPPVKRISIKEAEKRVKDIYKDD